MDIFKRLDTITYAKRERETLRQQINLLRTCKFSLSRLTMPNIGELETIGLSLQTNINQLQKQVELLTDIINKTDRGLYG